jgi:putative hydrolase of the HAD superfamily
LNKSSRTVWLFDLDNTLHDASHAAFAMLDASMNAFIARELQVGDEEADRLRRHYWQRYGATLLGLMRHHGVRGPYFLQDTHRLPGLEAGVRGHKHDLVALRRLPGRKVLLTNAPLSYARRVLRVLGVQHVFDELLSIEAMRMFGQWRPKPDTRMLKAVAVHLRVHPSRCVLVEDTLQHQKAARRVGMRTVWMQRWLKRNKHGPEVGVYLRRRPAYVCARITALQQLQQDVRP